MIFIAGFFALFVVFWLLFIPLGPLISRTLALLGWKAASFRYKDYVPVVVLLAAGGLASAVAGNQFLDLAELVHERSEVLQRVDTDIHRWAEEQRSAGATLFFTAFTYLGSPVGLGLIVAGVAAGLAARGRYRWAIYLIATSLAGALLVIELKVLFSRARPDLAVALRTAQGYSFPSGHAMGTTIVFGAISYLILRAKKPWRVRAAGLAAAAAIIAAVSMSRVYLGVHWISDIAAGLSAGTLWVVTATVAYETSRRIRMIRALRRGRAET
ncbi:MAG TPA: phosphatase PAP2 family protein [Thermoanaerobaculia bacterium]|nr:phosphatase PAP2 family protein [Thermoanaerobaculia bacterium]